jgi:hypothetical protein
MFPLGTVLFPHALLPLRVFEPRYRVMTERVLHGDGEFGVVLIERGNEVGGGDTRFDVGTIARVVRTERLPDGGYFLAAVGTHRIRVTRWLPDDPYPQAEVVDVEESVRADATASRERALAALDDVCAVYRERDPRVPELPEVAADAIQASYELAALAPLGPLDAQRVLVTASANDRLDLLAELLADHARLLRDGGDLLG